MKKLLIAVLVAFPCGAQRCTSTPYFRPICDISPPAQGGA
jgi:hypothetical protein